MNRIREIRESKGLTVEQLGDLAGTTGATISRLETGERKLTEAWMRTLAKALDVRPIDLIVAATIADFDNELQPYTYGADKALTGQLARLGLNHYRVTGNSVENAGIAPGTIILVNSTKKRIGEARTGDVVLVEVRELGNGEPIKVLRQFIEPLMVVTNRKGTNVALQLDMPDLRLELKGVVVPDGPEPSPAD